MGSGRRVVVGLTNGRSLCLVVWSFCLLVVWSFCLFVWSFLSVRLLFCCLFVLSVWSSGRSVCSSGRVVVVSGRLVRLVVWSSGRLVVWSSGRLVVWSFFLSVRSCVCLLCFTHASHRRPPPVHPGATV